MQKLDNNTGNTIYPWVGKLHIQLLSGKVHHEIKTRVKENTARLYLSRVVNDILGSSRKTGEVGNI